MCSLGVSTILENDERKSVVLSFMSRSLDVPAVCVVGMQQRNVWSVFECKSG